MSDTMFEVVFNNGEVETHNTLRSARNAIFRKGDADQLKDADVLPARIAKDGVEVAVFTTWQQHHGTSLCSRLWKSLSLE